jgi:hypothetical protein
VAEKNGPAGNLGTVIAMAIAIVIGRGQITLGTAVVVGVSPTRIVIAADIYRSLDEAARRDRV